MKKFIVVSVLAFIGFHSFAQDPTAPNKPSKQEKKEQEKIRRNSLAKQEEEGVLIFSRQTAGGFQLRTNGYGAFLEIGRSRSPRFANLYVFEFSEIKHPKEEKFSGDGFLSNSFVYGKINNFYQTKLGFGQQYVFGQKGNKNGIAVLGIFHGGFSMGMAKPYYVKERATGRDIKYDSKDSVLFLTPSEISGGSGFTKGWSEIEIKPGVYFKTGLRFDFNRFNERISALEIGMSVDYYFSGVPQMVYNKAEQLFFQGHIAYIFGKRK